jgi:hypothetical protein
MRISIQDDGVDFDWAPYFQVQQTNLNGHRLSGFYELYFKDSGRISVAHIPIISS